MGRYDQEKLEKAYGEGVKEAKNENFMDGAIHSLTDDFKAITPGEESDESKSRDRGYHDYHSGKAK